MTISTLIISFTGFKFMHDYEPTSELIQTQMFSYFAIQFNEMKDTKSKVFIKQIEQIDLVYNKTKNIFFDNEFLYLEPAK